MDGSYGIVLAILQASIVYSSMLPSLGAANKANPTCDNSHSHVSKESRFPLYARICKWSGVYSAYCVGQYRLGQRRSSYIGTLGPRYTSALYIHEDREEPKNEKKPLLFRV